MAKRKSATQAGMISKAKEFPGVSHYRDRHGKLRWRYRKDGFTTNLGTEYGSPEFLRRYTAAVKGERLPAAEAAGRTSQAPSGSLSQVIESWYKSPAFMHLGDSTKQNYRYVAEALREEHGQRSAKGLTRANIHKMMAAKADTPAAANSLLRVLRFLLDHARDVLEIIDSNPAREVERYRMKNPDGIHTWTEAEIRKFQERWPEGTTADLVIALMLYTGAARSDAVQLGPRNIKDGRLQYERQKMKGRDGVLVDIPLHPELQRRLEPLMDQDTFLQTDWGKPRSANGLTQSIRGWVEAAKLPHCTSHGLRKACARRLAEAGATPHEIMSVTGHKTLGEVARYTQKVQRAGLADSAIERIK